jgi:four helix bundle protein
MTSSRAASSEQRAARSGVTPRRNVTAPVTGGFRGLIAYQKAEILADEVFRAVSHLPVRYQYLASQVIRAATSVPANIAEGYGRSSLGDYVRFLEIARGSLNELEYFLGFLSRHNLTAQELSQSLLALHLETGRTLHGLIAATVRKNRATWNRSGV